MMMDCLAKEKSGQWQSAIEVLVHLQNNTLQVRTHRSGQIIFATSHDQKPQNVGLLREIPLFQGT